MLSRMKYIDRWALMRNTRKETLSEHTLDVAAIAHALAVISNKRLGTCLDAQRAAVLGIYHDMPEIITGDMPTPIKHGSPEMKAAYKSVEQAASKRLISMLPEYMATEYEGFFIKREEDSQLWKLVKAADKISALIKCIEEEKAGNTEFSSAKESVLKLIEQLDLPAANIFLSDFIGCYSNNLDELQQNIQI